MSHPSLNLLDEEFHRLPVSGGMLPGPPPCFATMQGEFLQYESRSMLKARFPVSLEYSNPLQTMQGGFIAALLDNVLGPLSYLAARRACTTLDLHTQFIRSPQPGDVLTVTARVISRGASTIVMQAEAVNGKGKLVATAVSTALILKDVQQR